MDEPLFDIFSRRSRRRGGIFAAALIAVLAIGSGVGAQSPDDGGDAAALPTREQFYAELTRAYQTLDAYSDTLVITTISDFDEDSAPDHPIKDEEHRTVTEFAISRSQHLFAFDLGELHLRADGSRVALVIGDQLATAKFGLSDSFYEAFNRLLDGGTLDFPHPAAATVLGANFGDSKLAPGPFTIDRIEPAQRNGRDGRWLYARADRSAHFGEPVEDKIAFWQDAETRLLGVIRIDETESIAATVKKLAARHGFSPIGVNSSVTEIEFQSVRIDKPEPPERFQLPDPSEYTELKHFALNADESAAQPGYQYLNKPAPLFTAPTPDGGEVSLASLRGKVVMLDFWATWCVPCLVAMPEVYAMSKEFDAADFFLLGVNHDAPEDYKVVDMYLKQRGFDHQQVYDPTGAIKKDYPAGIPCVVLIDREGIVRTIEVGVGPKTFEKLKREIAALIAEDRPESAAK